MVGENACKLVEKVWWNREKKRKKLKRKKEGRMLKFEGFWSHFIRKEKKFDAN